MDRSASMRSAILMVDGIRVKFLAAVGAVEYRMARYYQMSGQDADGSACDCGSYIHDMARITAPAAPQHIELSLDCVSQAS